MQSGRRGPCGGGREETFLRVRANRQTRLNARIGKMKRRKQDEGQVCPLCSRPLSGSEEEMSRHVEQCLAKREGSCMTEDDSVDIENENGNRFEEYEWCGQKRIRATTLLEGGFREMPSTSNGESSKQEALQKTCKNSDIEKITEDSAVTTFEALKARVRELERQLSRGDRYKCLICMDSYTMPLTSIQCWHVHCEECWLRTLVRHSATFSLTLLPLPRHVLPVEERFLLDMKWAQWGSAYTGCPTFYQTRRSDSSPPGSMSLGGAGFELPSLKGGSAHYLLTDGRAQGWNRSACGIPVDVQRSFVHCAAAALDPSLDPLSWDPLTCAVPIRTVSFPSSE
ncbi:E3 ubiquitin-protein ligase RNF220 isoform 4-T6 [Macrochelys suwanniensis]